jgi:DNA-binding PadR family transcriptional regulator
MWSRREFRWGRHYRERLFERGDLKYVVLGLLKEKPRHGYDIIRELEDRFSGFYAPSPGAVYPTLQMLQDMGQVTATERDSKKVYTITDVGLQFLAERKPMVDEIRGRMREHWDAEFSSEVHRVMHDLRDDLRDLAQSFAGRARRRWPDADQGHRIREVVGRAKKEIENILNEERPPAGSARV